MSEAADEAELVQGLSEVPAPPNLLALNEKLAIVKNNKFRQEFTVTEPTDDDRAGQEVFDRFMTERSNDIETILNLFDEKGNLKPEYKKYLSATTFNDLYKWTMSPVIRKLELMFGKIIVTFGIDLRDEDMKKVLLDDPKLREYILENLKSLETREFNGEIFNIALSGPARSGILTQEQIKDVVFGANGAIRTLVPSGGVKDYGTEPNRTGTNFTEVEDVSIYFYDKVVKGKTEHFIEAVGPWHKVTWLETTMMQAVYLAKLRYDLEKRKAFYGEWLYSALLRCAKSIAFTKKECSAKKVNPALFAGRRTGGLPFTLLQHLMFADNFTQFVSPTENVTIEGSKSNKDMLACLGTSSCDAIYILKKLDLPCHKPVGTHAHELSMVSSILFAHLDMQDRMTASEVPLKLPVSQLIGHYLYYKHSYKAGPMPMLPDTLGSRAFCMGAFNSKVNKKEDDIRPMIKPTGEDDTWKLLDIINSARQDSGELNNFLQNMTDFGYKHPCMASEIDTCDTLHDAVELGYKSFGAGGFFGDSAKVWDDKTISSNSMAVKAVRVFFKPRYNFAESLPPILAKLENGLYVGYPGKIGDPKKGEKQGEGKLSLDKNIPDELYEAIKTYLYGVRTSCGKPDETPLVLKEQIDLDGIISEEEQMITREQQDIITSNMETGDIQTINGKKVVSVGGRRTRRKGRKVTKNRVRKNIRKSKNKKSRRSYRRKSKK
jgi:hypothetical protein